MRTFATLFGLGFMVLLIALLGLSGVYFALSLLCSGAWFYTLYRGFKALQNNTATPQGFLLWLFLFVIAIPAAGLFFGFMGIAALFI